MFFRIIVLVSFTLSFILTSCSPKHSEIVLAEYGDREITMGEFEKAYAKNAGGYEEAKDDSLSKLKNFLDLYVNFKMKLRDAEVRGFDNNSQLKDELEDYRKKVGVTYLLEKQIVDPGIRALYDKRKYEIRVSHIMVRPDTAGDEAAKKLAQSYLDSIKQGASFEEMAKKYSQDNFSKPLGGDIFYITAGMLPIEFEEAAYATKVGEVYPEVVQTRFGFHLIKLTEKRERIPQIRASHILVDFMNENNEQDTIAARAKMDSIVTLIEQGEEFADVAAKYSEDPGTKEQGGDLGFFERRMMVKEFDEAAFNLEVNEVSDIVKTQFGYHIIKLTEKKSLPAFAQDRESLKKIFQQTRYQQEYDALVDSLEKRYNYNVNEETVEYIVNNSDSAKVGDMDPFFEDVNDKVLLTYSDKKVTAGEFFNRIAEDGNYFNKVITENFLKSTIEKVGADYLLEEEAMNLEKKDPDFASLMEDYKNGIYIFKLQDDEIWSQIKIDSTRLYQHYLDTKEKYVWPDRIGLSEIFARQDSTIQHYYKLLQEGADFDSLASAVTERPGYKEKAGDYGLVVIGNTIQSLQAEKLENVGDYSEPFPNSGGFSIVRLNKKEPSRIKTFEEAKAEVSGSFQDSESKRLEKEYLDSLKKRYEPEINYDKLEQAFKGE